MTLFQRDTYTYLVEMMRVHFTKAWIFSRCVVDILPVDGRSHAICRQGLGLTFPLIFRTPAGVNLVWMIWFHPIQSLFDWENIKGNTDEML